MKIEIQVILVFYKVTLHYNTIVKIILYKSKLNCSVFHPIQKISVQQFYPVTLSTNTVEDANIKMFHTGFNKFLSVSKLMEHDCRQNRPLTLKISKKHTALKLSVNNIVALLNFTATSCLHNNHNAPYYCCSVYLHKHIKSWIIVHKLIFLRLNWSWFSLFRYRWGNFKTVLS